MPTHAWYFRKDLARILQVSPWTIDRNEKRFGLDLARCDINARLIRYKADIAERELRKRNLWPGGGAAPPFILLADQTLDFGPEVFLVDRRKFFGHRQNRLSKLQLDQFTVHVALD